MNVQNCMRQGQPGMAAGQNKASQACHVSGEREGEATAVPQVYRVSQRSRDRCAEYLSLQVGSSDDQQSFIQASSQPTVLFKYATKG